MVMRYMQRVGKALMLPVAVLPAAGLLFAIGYAMNPMDWGETNAFASFFISAGLALIGNIPILFAVGIAYGMSKDRDGAAAIAGLVGYLTVTSLLNVDHVPNLIGELSTVNAIAFGSIENAFVGIISGIIAGEMYNRFSKTELPAFLAFFSGRRFVPIVTVGAMSLVSFVLLFLWPPVFGALVSFGQFIVGLGAFGAGLYGFFNRLLIPFGLHHTLNAVFWFDMVGINDLGLFWAGPGGGGVVGETGRYMAGFFPVMMFGLPGACLAMYRAAEAKHKKRVYALMFSAAITSFATGLTEPVEFAFMFVAPLLYVVHAVLTGVSMFIIYSLRWIAGFSFSAGAIDLLVSSQVPFAQNWFMLPVFGVGYFFVYYAVFSFFIKKFDLKTPGRGDEDFEGELEIEIGTSDWGTMAKNFVEALGGVENIADVDNCATRLRVEVKDYLLVKDRKLKEAGAVGVIKPSKTSVQIVVGPKVQFVADEINRIIKDKAIV